MSLDNVKPAYTLDHFIKRTYTLSLESVFTDRLDELRENIKRTKITPRYFKTFEIVISRLCKSTKTVYTVYIIDTTKILPEWFTKADIRNFETLLFIDRVRASKAKLTTCLTSIERDLDTVSKCDITHIEHIITHLNQMLDTEVDKSCNSHNICNVLRPMIPFT